jgi:hypothetical protein
MVIMPTPSSSDGGMDDVGVGGIDGDDDRLGCVGGSGRVAGGSESVMGSAGASGGGAGGAVAECTAGGVDTGVTDCNVSARLGLSGLGATLIRANDDGADEVTALEYGAAGSLEGVLLDVLASIAVL